MQFIVTLICAQLSLIPQAQAETCYTLWSDGETASIYTFDPDSGTASSAAEIGGLVGLDVGGLAARDDGIGFCTGGLWYEFALVSGEVVETDVPCVVLGPADAGPSSGCGSLWARRRSRASTGSAGIR